MMTERLKLRRILLVLLLFFPFLDGPSRPSLQAGQEQSLDQKVKSFLGSHRYSWRDMNVPGEDGQALYNIIVEKGYKNALEIGTSTGHSAVWIAWALSKTGGKLITVEIDEGRYKEALANFENAGLSPFIDARLADAHELVPELKGPFDFVFIDADKGWYVQYAQAVIPNLLDGGCIAAHNVSGPRPGTGPGFRRRGYGGADYWEFMSSQPGFVTSIHPESRGDLAVSFKSDKGK